MTMIVQACLNGSRAVGFHPGLPVTAASIAADGAACVAAGASELHVHPRDARFVETLAANAVGDTVAALRAACPGTPVGVSTGAWIEGTLDRTVAAIEGWRVLPDYASVNLSEDGATLVMAALARRGVGVEAGLGDEADARRLLRMDATARVLRILIEIAAEDAAEAVAAAGAVERVLLEGNARWPRLLHGCGGGVWPLVGEAAGRRFSTRVGLEDGDRLPDGTVAAGNAALVEAAVGLLSPRSGGGR
jgi:uncharacterized protein (DUF849 family)